jgi:peptidoglycan-associated lipoprotein
MNGYRMIRRPALVAVALLFALTWGCAKNAKEAPPTPPPPPPQETPAPPPEPPKEQPPTPPPAPAITSSDFQPVFFDLDSYTLRDDARSALDANARLLREHPDARLAIEGHCDERGTVEYNQALGERRAQAARDYLVQAGIAAARLSTVSYGKERPFETGHDEAAWAKNRRAQPVVQ